MTNPEAPPVAVWYKIVVCGTCDNVFRVHAGRPTCPTCGGEPVIELYDGEISLPPGDDSSPTQGEGEAPAEEPRVEEPALVENPVTGWHYEAEPEVEEETSPPEAGEDGSTEGKDI